MSRLHIPIGKRLLQLLRRDRANALFLIFAALYISSFALTPPAAGDELPKKLISAQYPGYYSTDALFVQPDLSAAPRVISVGNHPACPFTLATMQPGGV